MKKKIESNMQDITPIKYQIENIMGEIDEVGELDFSKDEKIAIKKLEQLFKKELEQSCRELIGEDEIPTDHPKDKEVYDCGHLERNNLRAEMREKLKEVCK